MAAYWHILLPIEVHIQDVPVLSELFEKKYAEDFVFDELHEYQVESPKLSDGTRLTFNRTEKRYHLDWNLLKKEFPGFYADFITCFQEYATSHEYNIYSVARDESLANPFLKEFNAIEMGDDFNNYLTSLDAIEDNYFMNHYRVPGSVVYHGYPFSSAYSSSMRVISLLHSHEKMQVIPEETVAFHNFVDFAQEKLKDKYVIAKYIFVAGF